MESPYPAPAPQGRSTLAQEAYRVIKQKIVRLELAPGQPFSEAKLAAELGQSKTPVREALARLHREGLVEVVPRSGYRVAPVTLKDARDLFHLRILLEGEAAALAAARADDARRLLALEELCRTSYDPRDAASVAKFLEANTQLHLTVAAMSGNDRLVAALAQVLEPLERLFHLGLTLTTRAEEIVHEHRDLLDAIVRGDPRAARQIAEAQCRTSQKMVMDALLSSPALLSANVGAAVRALPDRKGHS